MYFLFINTIKVGNEKQPMKEFIISHIDWSKTQIRKGVLLQAGKWGDSGGAGIIKADGYDQALAVLQGDPLVKNGVVDFELRQFFPDVALESA